MKTSNVIKCALTLFALMACATFTAAQNRERFGISAKAGGVNAVSGKVSVKRGEKAARMLSSQDDLESGDIVTTFVGSQVEVLLNPGAYLRLAEQSEFVMEDTSLNNLLVRLTKGSAIVEATGPDNLDLYIPIVTNQHRLTIIRPGIYRINVSPNTTEVFVRKGRMALSDNKDDVVKGGNKVTFTSAGPTIAKLSKNDTDEFDEWSKTRGQTLARANEKLSARTVNGYLNTGFGSSSFGGSGFGGFGFSRWGLWTWSPFSSCYTFLPFHYGWGTPYGGGYGAYAPYYGNSYHYNQGPYGQVITNNNSTGGYTGGTGSGSYGTGSGSYGTGGSTGSGGGSGGGGYTGSGSSGRGVSSSPGPASQAGPRDPDSGGRSINTLKQPIN